MRYREKSYEDEPYEDELDRLRARQQARHQRKKNARDYDEDDRYAEDDDDEDEYDYDYEDDYQDGEIDYDDEDDFIIYDMEEEESEILESATEFERSRRAVPGGAPVKATARNARNSSRNRQEIAKPVKPAKKRRQKRPLFRILSLVAVLVAGYLLFQWVRDDHYWTIAVFGVDSRDGNVGKGSLSDVEMLCSINKKTGEIRLVSVFRDSYLRIDQKDDYDKINEAYFKGGHKQAVDALRDNLDLQIDDYATFNWKAVVDAINVLGGVDLEITDKEFAYINSFITETVESTGVGSVHLAQSGMNHLDGVQAVAYARLRLMDTDFNRTERQRKVLGLAMEKAKQADFATLKNLVSAVYPQLATSVGIDDLVGMARNARKYYIGQTSGFPFSHQEMKIDKKSCVIPTTLESNVIQLHGFLYDQETYTPSETVKKISRHIAEKTGLGDPGKDTESGKNVGAEGNNEGGQGAAGNPPAQTQPAQTQPAAPPEETAPPETESLPEESTQENESEPPSEEETVAPLETEEEQTDEVPAPETGSSLEAPSADPEPDGPGGGPGADSGSHPESSPETNASLEAPGGGSGNTEATEPGPGV